MKLSFAYAFFALIATVANIATQDFTLRVYFGPFHVVVSVLAGTLAGLLLKYVLDKKYIFRFYPRNAVHDGQTFLLYSFMGLLTTVIFWGFEFGFDYLFKTTELRYLGGVIGLAIGYVAKYHLDKKFVFPKNSGT